VKIVYHEERHGRGEATVREREIKRMKKELKKNLASGSSCQGN